ncbi:MAG: hypothetical protein ACK559_05715, partial [bacterium]
DEEEGVCAPCERPCNAHRKLERRCLLLASCLSLGLRHGDAFAFLPLDHGPCDLRGPSHGGANPRDGEEEERNHQHEPRHREAAQAADARLAMAERADGARE